MGVGDETPVDSDDPLPGRNLAATARLSGRSIKAAKKREAERVKEHLLEEHLSGGRRSASPILVLPHGHNRSSIGKILRNFTPKALRKNLELERSLSDEKRARKRDNDRIAKKQLNQIAQKRSVHAVEGDEEEEEEEEAYPAKIRRINNRLIFIPPTETEFHADRRLCEEKCSATWTDAEFRSNLGYRLGFCDSKTVELVWKGSGTCEPEPEPVQFGYGPVPVWGNQRVALPTFAGQQEELEYVCRFKVAPKQWQPYFAVGLVLLSVLACMEGQRAEVAKE